MPRRSLDPIIERLLEDAERRLREAGRTAEKIHAEIAELKVRLIEAKEEAVQLTLPLERTRGLSSKWTTVLNFIVLRSPNPVSIDDILQFASQNNLGLSRATVRAQLHNYERRGFVDRISEGLYLATAAAKAYCDY